MEQQAIPPVPLESTESDFQKVDVTNVSRGSSAQQLVPLHVISVTLESIVRPSGRMQAAIAHALQGLSQLQVAAVALTALQVDTRPAQD